MCENEKDCNLDSSDGVPIMELDYFDVWKSFQMNENYMGETRKTKEEMKEWRK